MNVSIWKYFFLFMHIYKLYIVCHYGCRLGLSYNNIITVENGSISDVPHLRELHLDHNSLTQVPGGLNEHKYIQVEYEFSSVIFFILICNFTQSFFCVYKGTLYLFLLK